jgi:hypothetical protein
VHLIHGDFVAPLKRTGGSIECTVCAADGAASAQG